ncbi:unnamed protein product [Rhizoctonia solani]|uniref:NADH dehydrogenase n=1 Tax=Rhizoctonia solani TaxID=456999 RepID=A0A8H3GIR1_9AGAM|nr:unnamed protein product [Rhizoctonia solani]
MSLTRRVALSGVPTRIYPWRRLYSSTELDVRKGDRERLVVIGSGWAGFGVIREVDKKKYQTVVISPRSYFAFTPLLASTAVGTLEFRTAIEPVRRKGVELYQAWAETVDFENKSIVVQSNLGTGLDKDQGGEKFTVKYDKLVIAPGAYSQTFNIPGVTQHAYFLKDVSDARRIRQRILSNFERAALPTTSPSERDRLLHFAIVGGGATGVEFAAELHDLLHDDLPSLYPTQGTKSLVEQHARITIYDVAPRILGMFDTALAEFAERHLRREGVTIRPNHIVERVEPDMLHFKGGEALVIAPGAYSQTFNIPGVTQHAYFLKDVSDARRIRQRILSNFERAALPTTSLAERDKLLHFAIVGGGATGVEFAAELHDLLHDDLPSLYPTQGTKSLVEQHARITIYDVAPKILGMFDTALGEFAERHLKREGVTIRPNHIVERVEPDMLHFKGGEAVSFGMLVWATGLATNPFVAKMKGVEKEPSHQARILTDAKLRVLKEGGGVIDDVYALGKVSCSCQSYLPVSKLNALAGDCAIVKDGPVLPTTAQVASQKAKYLVKHLNGDDTSTVPDFAFKNFGALAYVGGWRAIMQGESQNVKGWAAWVIWRGAYLTKSVSWRNKILIPTLW